MTDKTPTDAQRYLNVASQCAATATSELTKNVLVDGGSGTLRELLNDAADAIRAGWGQPAQAAEPVAWMSPWRKDQVTTDYDAYGKQGIPLYAAPQPVALVPLDEARRLFDAGWKACANFCNRDDVVADGIIGFGACPQFEAAFSAAQPVAREPLTDAQREKIIEAVDWYNFPQDVIDAVERAHGIKGGQHAE